ncbi:MAG: hypothetical protein WCR21_01220 [Bacteroidota bacterium]
MKKNIAILLSAILLLHCAPARYVKPLKKNEQVACFTFGGPIIQFAGAAIPIPFTTIGYARGLNDKVTGYANLHSTSLLFSNLQIDLGTSIALFQKENKYGFSASPALQIATSLKAKNSFRIWPSTDLNFYYHPKEKASYWYTGLNAWFDLTSTKAHQEPQSTHIIPNMHGGYVVIKDKWQHQFQLSYFGLGMANLPNVVSYVGIAQKGSLGFHYALIRKF